MNGSYLGNCYEKEIELFIKKNELDAQKYSYKNLYGKLKKEKFQKEKS